jgi:hypothetical protein
VRFDRRFDIGVNNYEELLFDRTERNRAISTAQVGSSEKKWVVKDPERVFE